MATSKPESLLVIKGRQYIEKREASLARRSLANE